ncbi:hypothetical protein RHSIM_RhsimUnG0090900 [Rhododendron simsii]|uniref:Uncharacterized protein n=1 Tax=Rhododendron simsii TaxID=118357 RepID=A0A834FW07_RHOSS|nr:hypothetical protein RHSIM_RhsimUnG0090900 [Rhododendron simsii]
MSEGAIFNQAIGPDRPGRTRGLGLGATKSNLLGAKNNDQAPSQSSIERDRQFMKMKSKVQKMKRFLEAMGYIDDTDDDSDEFNEAPNENHPDASSAHREMTIGNNQASPEEINLAHRSQPEPTPFPRPNQQADSHHQCEPGSTAAPDLAMWKQAEASRNARKVVAPPSNKINNLLYFVSDNVLVLYLLDYKSHKQEEKNIAKWFKLSFFGASLCLFLLLSL